MGPAGFGPATKRYESLCLGNLGHSHATCQTISAQVPISDWHARFPDPTLADAILDRSIPNAYRITLQGDSQRKIRGFQTISHT